MAPKKTTQKESKFYVVKTMSETKEKLEKTINTYREKYVKKQVETGREFITELKADPVKKIDDLIDDSKDAIKKAKASRMETLQKRVDTAKKDVRGKIEKLNKETRKVYEGLEHDARLIVEEVISLSKEKLDKLPMKKTIEGKISAGIDAIPSKLNLPSKDDLDNLVIGIDGVNKKVDSLSREFAGA